VLVCLKIKIITIAIIIKRTFVKCLANIAAIRDATRRSADRQFQTTALDTAKSLAPNTVLVLCRTSVCEAIIRPQVLSVLTTNETGMLSSARYAGVNKFRYIVIANLNLIR